MLPLVRHAAHSLPPLPQLVPEREDEEEAGDDNNNNNDKDNKDAGAPADAAAAGPASAEAAAAAGREPLLAVADDPLMQKPPHGTELFLNGVPRESSEEQLRELCGGYGAIVDVRLIVRPKPSSDAAGGGGGVAFAFVTFAARADADAALAGLAEAELGGRKLTVAKAQSKHRLFVGGLPKNMTADALREVIAAEANGLENIDLPASAAADGGAGGGSVNRGYAFLDYYNAATAERARKALSRVGFTIGGRSVTVSWADVQAKDAAGGGGGGKQPPAPSAELQAAEKEAAEKVKSVYVKGVPDDWASPEDKLRELFVRHGAIEKVVLPAPRVDKKKRDFAFVHFEERSAALAAVEAGAVVRARSEGKGVGGGTGRDSKHEARRARSEAPIFPLPLSPPSFWRPHRHGDRLKLSLSPPYSATVLAGDGRTQAGGCAGQARL